MQKGDDVSQGESQENSAGQNSNKCKDCIQKDLEADEWKRKYEMEVEQRKDLKKVYLNLTVRFSELHSKYEDLVKTSSAHRPTSSQTADEETAAGGDIYSTTELKFLKCMPLDKKNDCTFILHCLKYGYKSDPSALATKTLKGKNEWTEVTDGGERVLHSGKAPLTPEKVDRMKGLFVERISKCEIGAADFGERIKDSYINKLIAAGIRNLSRKYKN